MVAPRSSACRRADGPSMPVSVRQQRAIDDTRALVRWIVSTNEQGITSQGMLARAFGWSAPQLTLYLQQPSARHQQHQQQNESSSTGSRNQAQGRRVRHSLCSAASPKSPKGQAARQLRSQRLHPSPRRQLLPSQQQPDVAFCSTYDL
eukprot:6630552-Prymnesium_polylepis.1